MPTRPLRLLRRIRRGVSFFPARPKQKRSIAKTSFCDDVLILFLLTHKQDAIRMVMEIIKTDPPRSERMSMPAIAQPAPVNSAPIPLITRGSETKSAAIHWIWPGRIARAKLTLVTGAPGSGKSALAASIIAAVTTGGAYPCREGRAPQGAVLLVCPDGDPDVLVPRLKAAGADLGRLHLIRQVQGAKGLRRFDPATDLPLLAEAARSIKDLSLIVIDGLYLPTGRSAARTIQALLDPLATFADVQKVAVTAIVTSGAFNDRSPKVAAFDAQALGAARAAFALEADPADEKRRVLVEMKNELAPIRGCSPSGSPPGSSGTVRARRGSNSSRSIIR